MKASNLFPGVHRKLFRKILPQTYFFGFHLLKRTVKGETANPLPVLKNTVYFYP